MATLLPTKNIHTKDEAAKALIFLPTLNGMVQSAGSTKQGKTKNKLSKSMHQSTISPFNNPPIAKSSRTTKLKKKMVPEAKKSTKHKRVQSPDFDKTYNSPINEDYEHRTVNSMADIPEPVQTANVVKKKVKRHRTEPIDSEVEIPIAKRPRSVYAPPSISDKQVHQLQNIKETMLRATGAVDQEKLAKEKNKIKKKKEDVKKTANSPSPPPILIRQNSPKDSSPVKQNIQKKTPVKAIENKEIPEEKYPVLKNEELVKRFLTVTMTNNQKGRIRQVMRDILKGTSPTLLPEVINNRIQAILNSSQNLTDTDLRKIRILYNMLKTSVGQKSEETGKANKQKKRKNDGEVAEKEEKKDGEVVEVKNKPAVKKMKRYVVFVGNLPPQVTKQQLLEHFCNLRECIKDVRILKNPEGKKTFAYLELENEPSYQLALSQNHTMMVNKRINVLYTTNKKSKMSKAEAKAKGAKLQAMAKKGQLVGSIPLNKKRSHRRAIMRKAMKDKGKQHNQNNAPLLP